MAWMNLLLAGLLEVGWAVGLKYTQGFSRFWPSVWTLVGMLLSFWFLSQAIRSLPLGTAYAVWTGVGVVGTAILGMLLFDEPRSPLRLICIVFIVSGIVGLKILSSNVPSLVP